MFLESNLIVIGYAHSAADVVSVQAAFRAADIPLVVMDETTLRVQPHYTTALGGIRLAVPRSCVPQGLVLLDQATAPRQTRFRPIWVLFILIAFLLGGVPAHHSGGVYVRRTVRADVSP